MEINMIVQDILPDGTITKVEYSVKDILTVVLERYNLDEPYRIIKTDILSRDEKQLSEAVREIWSILTENGINIDIPRVNAPNSDHTCA